METEARVAEAIAEAAASEDGYLGAIPRRKATKSDLLASLENDMKMHLGTRVDISQTSRGRGRITIHFTSIEGIRSPQASSLQRAADGRLLSLAMFSEPPIRWIVWAIVVFVALRCLIAMAILLRDRLQELLVCPREKTTN